MSAARAPFLYRPAAPASPVVIAVPHAGRDYPAAVVARARVPLATLERLEDRYADRLAGPAADGGAAAIVARTARAVIDLNRDPRELDPASVEGPCTLPTRPSARTRAGLGLIPRRLAREGELWRTRPDCAEVAARIATVHRPYHRCIADALEAAAARHGGAILIDCHSMPPLPGPDAPTIVFGTLAGRACAPHLVARAVAVAAACGLSSAVDVPYAGGYTLEAHGRPALDRYALQVEVDRAAYLTPDLQRPDPDAVARIGSFLARLADALAEALTGSRLSEAAE